MPSYSSAGVKKRYKRQHRVLWVGLHDRLQTSETSIAVTHTPRPVDRNFVDQVLHIRLVTVKLIVTVPTENG